MDTEAEEAEEEEEEAAEEARGGEEGVEGAASEEVDFKLIALLRRAASFSEVYSPVRPRPYAYEREEEEAALDGSEVWVKNGLALDLGLGLEAAALSCAQSPQNSSHKRRLSEVGASALRYLFLRRETAALLFGFIEGEQSRRLSNGLCGRGRGRSRGGGRGGGGRRRGFFLFEHGNSYACAFIFVHCARWLARRHMSVDGLERLLICCTAVCGGAECTCTRTGN
jgi:hypothetical protein